MSNTPQQPKVGDRITIENAEWDVVESWATAKGVKRRAWAIREQGGTCSYRKIGGLYFILKKTPPPVADYFFK